MSGFNNSKKSVPMEDHAGVFGGKQVTTLETGSRQSEQSVIDIEVVRKHISLRLNWILIWVFLGAGVTFSILLFRFANAIALGLMVVTTIFLWLSTKKIRYTIRSNFYTINLAKTLRGFIGKQMGLGELAPHGAQLGWIGIGVLFVEQIVFRHFLYYPISTGLYAVGFLLVLLSSVVLFAEKETKESSIILSAFAVSSVTSMVVASVLYGYISAQNYLFGLIALYAAEWLSRVYMKEIDVDELRRKAEERVKQEKEDIEQL